MAAPARAGPKRHPFRPALAICLRLALPLFGLLFWASTAASQSIGVSSNLSFGSFLAGSGGTVTVGPSGSRSKSGGVLLIGQGAGAAAAQFIVTGTPNASYAITLPSDNTVTLADENSHTLALNGFVSSPGGSGLLSAGGSQLLRVGATLSVGNGQAVGSYAGSFSVTVNFE